MLGAADLLKLLKDRGVTQAAIGRCLGLPSPRISEMYKGERRLQLDEAKKLVESFGVDEAAISPLSEPVARALAIYAAETLGLQASPEDERVEELAQELRAFSEFAVDPRVRDSVESIQGFLRGLRLAPNRAAGS